MAARIDGIGSVVALRLRDGGVQGGIDRVQLDRLTPKGRALAEAMWLGTALRVDTQIWVQSPNGRLPWQAWASYPDDSNLDPHDYLDLQARAFPDLVILRPESRAATVHWSSGPDDDLLTREQVTARLCDRHQITIEPDTWSGYVSRQQAPQASRHIGRTPLWSAGAVDLWTTYRRGAGARTDLLDPGPAPDLSRYASLDCDDWIAGHEWLISDHPWACAERDRRRENYIALLRERVDTVRGWTHSRTTDRPDPRVALGATALPLAEEQLAQAEQTIDMRTEREDWACTRHNRGDRGYSYPAHLVGPGAAAYPPPPGGFPQQETT